MKFCDVFIISNKINYSCNGMVGDYNISSFRYNKNFPQWKQHKYSLSKKSECFENGGLQPSYIVIIPEKKWNDYWASINLKRGKYTTDRQNLDFFNNYGYL